MRFQRSWFESLVAGASRRRVLSTCLALLLGGAVAFAQAADGDALPREGYRDVPMPAGIQVVPTELDGPVFADAQGRTLYAWPQYKHRNGYSGDAPGKVTCTDEVIAVTAGLMSPYPAGIRLPDLELRPSCAEVWPPAIAAADAEPIGDWTLLPRPDGRQQWAYREQALYTSHLDTEPGDVLGGTSRRYGSENPSGGDKPAFRIPVQPPPALPPGFKVSTTRKGRMLTTSRNKALYAFSGDSATQSNCRDECLSLFRPVRAAALARALGEWTIIERSPGVRQWVFRGQPLYTYLHGYNFGQFGADVQGWANVYTQRAPQVPESFTVQATLAGDVLADRHGQTIYTYNCGEDSMDSLACDHPRYTQVYRLAMCGGGDADKCRSYWPYVEAGDDQETPNRSWNIINIDPSSGLLATADSPGALRVWAFRDRPVYTFGRDRAPGDVHGGGTGEWRGQRNGLKAFWLRDDHMNGDL